MSNFPAPAVSWSDVARVCRRVCVLRERGQNEEAERVRSSELMEMLAGVRSTTDTDATITERLNSLFATEAERAANAAVLAEMLVPLLADQLRPLTTLVAPPAAASALVVASLLPAVKPAQPRRASIADFIDDMIAQEKPPEKPAPGAQRRAS